ncbi:MAG: HupE/UreJ family protein [Methylomicrobium sp.]
MMINSKHTVTLFVSIFLLPLPAFAHLGLDTGHEFVDGLIHPFLGLDHLLVMIAIGLWANGLGGINRWLLPLSFLSAMSAGAGLAFSGVSLTYPEIWVVLSVLAASVIVLRDWRLSSIQACSGAALFAWSHGYVHALEIAPAADQTAYALGFLVATSILHGAGLAAGLLKSTVMPWLRAVLAICCAATGLTLLLGL